MTNDSNGPTGRRNNDSGSGGSCLVDVELNLGMVRAGAQALREWDHENEAEELIVIEIFYRMLKCVATGGNPNS